MSLVHQISKSYRLLPGSRGLVTASRNVVLANQIEEKGRGEENVRFRKEDERLLRQLLQKVKSHADSVDVHGAESAKSMDLAALKEIVGKYNVSQDDLQKLIAWKHA